MKNKKIVGVGAALVDLLINESDEYIQKIGCEKGGMTLVERAQISQYLKDSSQNHTLVPGGSACNTIVGISQLGGKASFLGACGQDDFGNSFESGLQKAGVTSLLKKHDSEETGRVLSVVTPDAQRTMFTYLGASATLSHENIGASLFDDCSIVHLEGYSLFNPDLVLKILDQLKDRSIKVSLDLASFQVVEASKELLEKIMPSIDILLANEDEAKAYTGKNEEDSLEEFAKLCEIAVVKKGKKGALIARGNERVTVDAHVVHAVDTTGAGDLWASGFLYGLSQELPLKDCGELGALVASEVVQVFGAAIPNDGWERIHQKK